MPTLCLNSIVKNESGVILRMLTSVADIIDTYCICDTGSTDNTIQIIQDFFNSRNIQGKIINEPFVNFEHNRNVALQGCFGMSDFVLFLDADMVLNVRNFDKNGLADKHIYSILQGNESFYYPNVRIVKNDNLSRYVGVTHEYVDCPPYQTMTILEKTQLFITDIGDGGSKSDKTERDIRLLSGDLENNANNPRSLFYLANTYFDSNRLDEAIPYYVKRIEVGGWEQEIWYSNYRLGEIYKRKGDSLKAIEYWMEAYDVDPMRLENILKIIIHFRMEGNHKRAYGYIKMIADALIHHKQHSTRNNFLFMENSVYTHLIEYEMIIISYYLGIKNVDTQIASVLQNTTDHNIVRSVFDNMKFYQNKFPVILTKTYNDEMFYNVTISGKKYPIKFRSSTPCIIQNPYGSGYLMNVRYHNYMIVDKDGQTSYIRILPNDYDQEVIPVITMNYLHYLDDNFEITSTHITPVISKAKRLLGVEDVRLFYSEEKKSLLYLGTGSHDVDDVSVVAGNYDNNILSSQICCKQTFKESYCEKNWVYFLHNGNKRIIYNWSPLTVCDLSDNGELTIVKQYGMPPLFNWIRGSTCGYRYKNEIWFVCHGICFEAIRQYYDIFVVLDADTLQVIKTSNFFKYSEDRVQYTLGIIVKDDNIILSYSTGDVTSNVSVYNKAVIDKSMVTYSAML